ncbi:hypothetical protein [Reichenbachiella sp. MALMAid0571]
MVTEIKLSRGYFYNDNVVEIAKDLIGKVLVTNIDSQVTKGGVQ